MPRRFLLIIIMAAVFILFGCTTEDKKEGNNDAAAKPEAQSYRIGYSSMSMDNAFNQEFCEYLKQRCDELGIELILHDGKSDVAQQIYILEKWVEDEIDAVICSPVDPTAIQNSVDMCMQAGIPFINMDSECQRKTIYIGVDQYEYGYMAGEIVANWINQNMTDREVVTCGILDTPQSFDFINRSNGIIEGLTENCSRVSIIAHESYTTEEEAYHATQKILENNIYIDCFIIATEAGLCGAYDAVLATGIDTSKRCLVGLGASETALNRIAANTMIRGTVALGIRQFARSAVDLVVDAINGEQLERTELDITPITIKNVNKYLSN